MSTMLSPIRSLLFLETREHDDFRSERRFVKFDGFFATAIEREIRLNYWVFCCRHSFKKI